MQNRHNKDYKASPKRYDTINGVDCITFSPLSLDFEKIQSGLGAY